MIETPGETPVERRLRDLYESRSGRGFADKRVLATVSMSAEHAAAIDAGREALELLRKWRGPETWDWRMARKALLARCEETR